MAYAEDLKESLAVYKRQVLGVVEDGIWRKNGRPYPHILPDRLKFLNLLPPYRDDIVRFLNANPQVELHGDFHHLSSSQAMAFNLLYPLAAEPAGRRALMEVLELEAMPTDSKWAFEKVFEEKEGTNFDFFAELDDGRWILAELKLTEDGFSSAPADEYHLEKLSSIYQPRLEGRVSPELLKPTNFFPRYQLFRNLAGLRDDRDHLLLIYPKANVAVHDQAVEFVGLLNEPFRSRVQAIHLEDIVGRLLSVARNAEGRLISQLEAFARKYLRDNGP